MSEEEKVIRARAARQKYNDKQKAIRDAAKQQEMTQQFEAEVQRRLAARTKLPPATTTTAVQTTPTSVSTTLDIQRLLRVVKQKSMNTMVRHGWLPPNDDSDYNSEEHDDLGSEDEEWFSSITKNK